MLVLVLMLVQARVKAYKRGFERATKDFYPETSNVLVALNVPWFLLKLWKGFSALFDKRTLERIQVCGPHPSPQY